MNQNEARDLLLKIFLAGVDSARPELVLARHLPEKPSGRCVVIGAGKASAAMARALEAAWPDVDLSGVVVTRYGYGAPTERIEILEAAHPVPDEAGVAASRRILETARSAREGDLVLALISGGGSALLTAPKPPLTLADKIAVNKLLLASGATISEMNRVRRRLSEVKGGRLALAAHPARLVTLAISDIPGDSPADIASGPTTPDPTAGDDLTAMVERLGPDLPAAARELLLAPAGPAPGFDADFRLIATPRMALEAAAEVARAAGVTPLILGDAIEGESREFGIAMAGIAASAARFGDPVKPPAVLLSGGETTVTITGEPTGKGGPNKEFALSLALALKGHERVYALAGDTDGVDGADETAGAIVTPDTLARARAAGLDPAAALASHATSDFFGAIGDLVRTGPTLTNVNDLRAVLVL